MAVILTTRRVGHQLDSPDRLRGTAGPSDNDRAAPAVTHHGSHHTRGVPPVTHSRTRRTAAALIGTAALVAGPLAVSPADAAVPTPTSPPTPPRPDKADKADKAKAPRTKQLLKTVAGKDARLARISTSTAVTRLDDAYEPDVVAGIDESRDALAAIATALEGADSTFDVRAAAADLRAFRVENHRLVVTVVARAGRILDEATASGDTATADLATAAIEAALAVTATSPRSEIKDARAGLKAADEADDDSTEDETTDETEDETEDEALPAS